jgi:hypothetical protein
VGWVGKLITEGLNCAPIFSGCSSHAPPDLPDRKGILRSVKVAQRPQDLTLRQREGETLYPETERDLLLCCLTVGAGLHRSPVGFSGPSQAVGDM